MTATKRSSLLSKCRYRVVMATPASAAMRLTALPLYPSSRKAASAALMIASRLRAISRALGSFSAQVRTVPLLVVARLTKHTTAVTIAAHDSDRCRVMGRGETDAEHHQPPGAGPRGHRPHRRCGRDGAGRDAWSGGRGAC